MNEPSNKNHNTLSLSQSVAVIRDYDSQNPKPKILKLATKYNISSPQMKTLLLNREYILRSYDDELVRKRQEKIEFLGKVMYEYIRRIMQHGIIVDDEAVLQKAIEVKESIAVINFEPTHLWLNDFKKAYGIPSFDLETLRSNIKQKKTKKRPLSVCDLILCVSNREKIPNNGNYVQEVKKKEVLSTSKRPKAPSKIIKAKKGLTASRKSTAPITPTATITTTPIPPPPIPPPTTTIILSSPPIPPPPPTTTILLSSSPIPPATTRILLSSPPIPPPTTRILLSPPPATTILLSPPPIPPITSSSPPPLHYIKPTIIYERLHDDDIEVKPTLVNIDCNNQYNAVDTKNESGGNKRHITTLDCEIQSLEDALKHLRLLEEYAMLQDNFRAIGLLTQIEEVLQKSSKKVKT